MRKLLLGALALVPLTGAQAAAPQGWLCIDERGSTVLLDVLQAPDGSTGGLMSIENKRAGLPRSQFILSGSRIIEGERYEFVVGTPRTPGRRTNVALDAITGALTFTDFPVDAAGVGTADPSQIRTVEANCERTKGAANR